MHFNKSTSNHCSSQWIYELNNFQSFFFFFFANTSGYTSAAMRDSTVLASWVCPLMRASIVVANLCSTDFTDFFFLLEFYIKFYYYFFLIGISFLSIKNNTFSLAQFLEKNWASLFFFKYRYHMYRVSRNFTPLISCTITFDQNFIFTWNI